MKKILLAFDGTNFAEGFLEVLLKINSFQPVLATAIFLPIVDYTELLYSFGGMAGPLVVDYPAQNETATIEGNIARFESFCKENRILYAIHRTPSKHIIEQLKTESRYADMMLLSAKTFYENLGEDIREDYIENVLHKSECPIMLVPETFKAPKSIVLSYDGSASSVYAIKLFAYLFPEYHNLQTLLVYFDHSGKDIPERPLVEELAGTHFKNFTIFKLKMNPRSDFDNWLKINGDTLLVAGAYGRSLFSEMFRRSFISDIIRDQQVPVFIAHL